LSLTRFFRFEPTSVKSAVTLDRLECFGKNADSVMQL
jgi:hypothetical protein